MKANKKLAVPTIVIIAVVAAVFGGYFLLNNNTRNTDITDITDIDISALPVYSLHGSFVYDIYNTKEAVGICDYVFIGKVVSYDGTQYRDPVPMMNEKGKMIEVGSPYTNYTVFVLKNIKGNLQTEEPISITKQGGIVQTNDRVFVFEDDELPIADNVYVFLCYAQADGSLLVSGPKSNILINVTDGRALDSTKEYQEYEKAVENEIIPIERERYISVYEK